MLILTLKKDGKLLIGDKITLTLVNIRGKEVKIGVEAPPDVLVLREDLAHKEPPA